MNLLIDLGNSRIKWAQHGSDCWLPGVALHRGRELGEVLDEIWTELSAPEHVILVSVVNDVAQSALDYWLHDRWNIVARRVFAQSHQLGITNHYREPSTLGADRWAALLGARELTDNACAIVDCGTAVTIDVLLADGAFAGGVILPGLHLMRHSLNVGTAGVGSSTGQDTNCMARTTGDGVAAGALFGLAGAIEHCLQEQERLIGDVLEVYLTGGDGPLLSSRLNRTVIEEPELVLKGLARVAEEWV